MSISTIKLNTFLNRNEQNRGREWSIKNRARKEVATTQKLLQSRKYRKLHINDVYFLAKLPMKECCSKVT